MVQLPTDILVECCEYLGPSDLCNFALANSRFRQLASRSRFRTVQLVELRSWKHFNEQIKRCRKVLKTVDALGQVQHLLIVPSQRPTVSNLAFQQQDFNYGPELWEPWKYASENLRASRSGNAPQWQGSVDFIATLRGLKQLTWACQVQIPLRIVRHLNSRVPVVRLHMHNFCLRSLLVPEGQVPRISREDLEIVTSQCLHTISREYRDTDLCDYNGEALIEMAGSGAAPNLQRVSDNDDPWANSKMVRRAMRGQTPNRNVLWPQGQISGLQVAKNRLKFLDFDNHSGGYLQHWHDQAGLNGLEALRLLSSIEPCDVSCLTEEVQFTSLKSLTVVGHSDRVKTLIQSLPALSSLRIEVRDLSPLESDDDSDDERVDAPDSQAEDRSVDEPDDKSIDQSPPHSVEPLLSTALAHCGSQLRSFNCPGILVTTEVIDQIRSICPQIEELGLSVHRRRGSATEVAEYKALGSLVALETLDLLLVCPNLKYSDVSLEVQVEVIRNVAVDDTLARSIYAEISRAKPAYARSLEHLTLRTDVYRHDSESGDVLVMLEQVGCSWRCTKMHNSSTAHACSAKIYLDEDRQRQESPDIADLRDILKTPLGKALQEVWPESKTVGLAKAWRSLSLESDIST